MSRAPTGGRSVCGPPPPPARTLHFFCLQALEKELRSCAARRRARDRSDGTPRVQPCPLPRLDGGGGRAHLRRANEGAGALYERASPAVRLAPARLRAVVRHELGDDTKHGEPAVRYPVGRAIRRDTVPRQLRASVRGMRSIDRTDLPGKVPLADDPPPVNSPWAYKRAETGRVLPRSRLAR
jgi:hypothetical protein